MCESAARLIRLARKLDRDTVLVGIDEGESDDAWRRFVGSHEMSWPQCRDNGRYAQPFGVHAYPTYVVIDQEGLIRARRSGYSSRETDAWLEEEIQKARAPARRER